MIDKNNGVLYFEDALAYRQRLLSTYVHDEKHYKCVQHTEGQLLNDCLHHHKHIKWDKICVARQSGSLGHAQCLPKDKDCALNRPIVPNCGHPLARLFNMAARGFAYVLMNVKFAHYNLFTTQEFVRKLCDCSSLVARMFADGSVSQVLISQSDVKDMYTEITHAEIESCVWEVIQRWLTARGSRVLNVSKTGRRGVAPGYSKNLKQASTMRVTRIASILLYELKHAYFHVGCKHIMQQVMGVSMGSKGGPVLAWCVCMINENRFHATLGRDSRYLRVFRYFDDVWQLLLVPSDVDGDTWVAKQVAALQSDCYPSSLRLIQNSLGDSAEMLACHTFVKNGNLHCVHRSKNAKYLQQGQQPRFASFVPFTSAHARRRTVMRNSGLGLLHRMFMDTKPTDVPMLLPTLQSYHTELCIAGYPEMFLPNVIKLFLQHPKVAGFEPWRMLLADFQQHCGNARGSSG